MSIIHNRLKYAQKPECDSVIVRQKIGQTMCACTLSPWQRRICGVTVGRSYNPLPRTYARSGRMHTPASASWPSYGLYRCVPCSALSWLACSLGHAWLPLAPRLPTPLRRVTGPLGRGLGGVGSGDCNICRRQKRK